MNYVTRNRFSGYELVASLVAMGNGYYGYSITLHKADEFPIIDSLDYFEADSSNGTDARYRAREAAISRMVRISRNPGNWFSQLS